MKMSLIEQLEAKCGFHFHGGYNSPTVPRPCERGRYVPLIEVSGVEEEVVYTNTSLPTWTPVNLITAVN